MPRGGTHQRAQVPDLDERVEAAGDDLWLGLGLVFRLGFDERVEAAGDDLWLGLGLVFRLGFDERVEAAGDDLVLIELQPSDGVIVRARCVVHELGGYPRVP